MKALKILAITVLFSFLFNLSYAQKNKQENDINRIINLYLDIKNGLVNDNGTIVKIQSNKLYRILTRTPFRGLTEDQGNLFGSYLAEIVDNAQQMCYTVNVKEQRPYFAALSIHLYDLLKQLKLNDITIYKQYCPMNNAYWMSETPVIENPYYNFSGYSTVGKTTEILAANK